MKRIVLAMVTIALATGLAFGQGGDVTFVEKFTFTIGTDDDITDSTFYVDMRDLGVVGSLLFETIFDSSSGFPDGMDSTRFRYRQCRKVTYNGAELTTDAAFDADDTLFFSLDGTPDTLVFATTNNALMTDVADTLDNDTGIYSATAYDNAAGGFYNYIRIVFADTPVTIDSFYVGEGCTVTPTYATLGNYGDYEPYLESDGSEKDYSYLQIYDEGTTFGNFDWDVTMGDNRAFWCAIEMGGIPWGGAVGLNVQHADSNGTPADNGLAYINVYKSKH